MLFPGWGQGQHCFYSQQELRGDKWQKLHLILSHIALECQLLCWVGSAGKASKYKTMALV